MYTRSVGHSIGTLAALAAISAAGALPRSAGAQSVHTMSPPAPQARAASSFSRSLPDLTASNTRARPSVQAVNYGKLALSFETCGDQANTGVNYFARGIGYNLLLTPSEAILKLKKPNVGGLPHPHGSDTLRLRLVGANKNPRISGRNMQPGKTSYFIGSDPRKWRTGIANYGKVEYQAVYPGIDLVYYGNQKRLEYDFVVAPGADPSRIALDFPGAKRVQVNTDGELVVSMDGDSVRWHKPVIYQQIAGRRKQVQGRFILRGKRQAGFALARYDARKPLVIDPVLMFATYLGGSQFDTGLGIAVDSAGNSYVAGYTDSLDFPTTNPVSGGGYDAFVTKLDRTGGRLLYSAYLGGSGGDEANAIAIDAGGNAYIAGITNSTNFPTTNAFRSTLAGGQDGFVAKVNPTGTGLSYASYLGGSGYDTASGIAVGAGGVAYVVGDTASLNFPTVSPYQAANGGSSDAFVSILDTNLIGSSSLLYSTYLGGSGDDYGYAIALQSNGRYHVTGRTSSSNFPTAFAFQSASGGVSDAFLTTFTPDGSSLYYSTYLGGSGAEYGGGIAVDMAGNAYVCGRTNSSNFPVRSAYQGSIAGNYDAFVVKVNTTGAGDGSLIYSTYLGGADYDDAAAIAVDVWGNAYVTGSTNSVTLLFGLQNLGYVVKLGAAGNQLLAGISLGRSGASAGLALAVDPAGNVYVTGDTNADDFPIMPGAFQMIRAGYYDAFVARVSTFTRLDLNHDDQPDLLFQNQSNGTLAYWIMSGNNELRFGTLSPSDPGPNWNLVGMADLNGDNDTDLLFQNQSNGNLYYWLMNRTAMVSGGFLNPPNPGAGWSLVGVADINGDGYADLLFQHQATGNLYYWLMNGTTMTGGGFLNPANPGTGWKVVAFADFNRDGKPDVLFQHMTSGDLYVWLMNGANLTTGRYLSPSNPGPGWKVVGTTDLNLDGQTDILLQNQSTGDIVYWLMNGTMETSVAPFNPSNPGGNVWKLVGPR